MSLIFLGVLLNMFGTTHLISKSLKAINTVWDFINDSLGVIIFILNGSMLVINY